MGTKKMTPKSSSTRKPPEPTDSHDQIEAWLAGQMPALQPIVREVDRMIRDTIPGLQYAIKWKKAYYGLPELGWIIELVAYDVSVNIVFHGGADFQPPPPLGDVDRSRYVKVQALDEVQTQQMQTWIEQAGDVEGWR